MKVWCKKYIVFLLLILLGLAAAAGIMLERNAIESQNKTYDIVADYADFATMSYNSAYSTAEWMEFLADYGVTKVALFETSIDALAGNPTTNVRKYYTKDIMYYGDWKNIYPADVVGWVESSTSTRNVLVVSDVPEEFDWIVSALESRVDGLEYEVSRSGDTGYLWLTGCANNLTGETLCKMSLGLWPSQVEMIESVGMEVVPRTKTVDGLNGATFANDVYEEFLPYNSPYFMNSGDSLLGHEDPNWAAMLTDYLEAVDGAFVVTEQNTEIGNIQWGDTQAFVESSACNAVRAFHTWDFVMKRNMLYGYDGPQEIVNSLYRAIYERNCRLINLNAIQTQNSSVDGNPVIYVTDPAAYERLITGLTDRMARYGYTHETVHPSEYYSPGMLQYLLLGLAEVAAAVLLLGLFVPLKNKYRYILLALGFIGGCGALYVMPNTSKIVMSLCGGMVMPAIAAVGILRYLNDTRHRWWDEQRRFKGTFLRMIPEILLSTVALAVISFGGALLVSAPLSESAYFIEMRMYRGVKFMQLVPLLIFILGYVQIHVFERYILRPLPGESLLSSKERRAKRKADWNKFLERPVKLRGVWYGAIAAVALLFLGAIGVYYIIRTGNTDSAVVSSAEMQFRNMLEELFVARPRMKEYMVGYPCMMLLVWAGIRRIPALPLLFGAGAVIGYTSIVNTFLHIRTAVAISFSRVFIGFGIGIVVGLCAVIAAELIYRLILYIRKRLA